MTDQPDTTEPTPACPVCAKPNDDRTWRICDRDRDAVLDWLDEIEQLHTLSHHPLYLIPARSGDGAGPVSGTKGRPIGLDVNVLDLALGEVLLSTDEDTDDPPWTGLEGWEQDWRTTLGLTSYGKASGSRLEAAVSHESAREVTLCGVIRFLRSQWPLAAQKHPAADEFHADIRRMHQHALRTLHMVEPAPWTFPCPSDHPTRGGLCGYRLRVTFDGRDTRIHCKRCSTDWTLTRLRLVGRATGSPAWVDAEAAARALGVDQAHLGPLVRDGHLKRRGDGDHRRYDINSYRREEPA